MDTLGIAELAGRTGFSRPTLRYYEEIGLLDAPRRTETGYRVYDHGVEARLQFIGRAKRLGLSLEEIRSLVAVWAGGECAVTRRQLRQLVEVRIAVVREQVEESAIFLRQLEGVHDRLDELLTSGQSETGCECAPELPHVSAVEAARETSASVAAALQPGRPSLPHKGQRARAAAGATPMEGHDMSTTTREDQTDVTTVGCGCGCGAPMTIGQGPWAPVAAEDNCGCAADVESRCECDC